MATREHSVLLHRLHIVLSGQRDHRAADDTRDYKIVRSYPAESSPRADVDGHFFEHRRCHDPGRRSPERHHRLEQGCRGCGKHTGALLSFTTMGGTRAVAV